MDKTPALLQMPSGPGSRRLLGGGPEYQGPCPTPSPTHSFDQSLTLEPQTNEYGLIGCRAHCTTCNPALKTITTCSDDQNSHYFSTAMGFVCDDNPSPEPSDACKTKCSEDANCRYIYGIGPATPPRYNYGEPEWDPESEKWLGGFWEPKIPGNIYWRYYHGTDCGTDSGTGQTPCDVSGGQHVLRCENSFNCANLECSKDGQTACQETDCPDNMAYCKKDTFNRDRTTIKLYRVQR